MAVNDPKGHLPDDVKRLKREETVCRFCGVSYLIFAEVKTLEKKVKQAEQKLRRSEAQHKRALEKERAEKAALQARVDNLQSANTNENSSASSNPQPRKDATIHVDDEVVKTRIDAAVAAALDALSRQLGNTHQRKQQQWKNILQTVEAKAESRIKAAVVTANAESRAQAARSDERWRKMLQESKQSLKVV